MVECLCKPVYNAIQKSVSMLLQTDRQTDRHTHTHIVFDDYTNLHMYTQWVTIQYT